MSRERTLATTVLDPAEDFGAALRRHREAAQRSLRELADATKLGVRTLDALERNHVDKLPPGIFRRAVVRAYAREVGLDPEHTLRIFLARHPDELPPPGPAIGPVSDAPARPSSPRGLIVAGVILIVVVALLLAARAFGRGRGDEAPPATYHAVAVTPGIA